MRAVFTAALVLSVLLAGCDRAGGAGAESSAGRGLTVFAAASLTEVFTELGTAFEAAHPGVEVTFNFAGSQLLATQIALGAPADVLASANRAQMARVRDAGWVGDLVHFAINRPVIIVPAGNPAGIERPVDLGREGVKLVVGAPTVPIGAYARRSFAELGILAAARANIVSNEEDVKQVLGKVMLGEADAGIVYRSDVTPQVADKLATLELGTPRVVARYPISVTTASPNPTLARSFIRFVLGDGASVLRDAGFGPP